MPSRTLALATRRTMAGAAGGVPPVAPSDLTATAVSASQIDLAWTDNSDNETGLNVYRGGVLIDTVAADETTYSDTGLDPATLYEYYITAVNGAGESAASNTDSATTGAIVTLQPDATAGIDTYLNSTSPTTNFGTSPDLRGRQADLRSLLKFDLSAVPAEATIISATLHLWNLFTSTGSVTVNFHAIKAANAGWTEAGATWNTIEGSTAWAGSAGCSTAGTDYETTAMGSTVYAANNPIGTEHTAALNAAQVQAWLTANHGMVFIRPAGGNPTTIWDSSDGLTAGLRPKLVIEYII